MEVKIKKIYIFCNLDWFIDDVSSRMNSHMDYGLRCSEVWLESEGLGERSVWMGGSVVLEEIPLVPWVLGPWSGWVRLWHWWDQDGSGFLSLKEGEVFLDNVVDIGWVLDEIEWNHCVKLLESEVLFWSSSSDKVSDSGVSVSIKVVEVGLSFGSVVVESCVSEVHKISGVHLVACWSWAEVLEIWVASHFFVSF